MQSKTLTALYVVNDNREIQFGTKTPQSGFWSFLGVKRIMDYIYLPAPCVQASLVLQKDGPVTST